MTSGEDEGSDDSFLDEIARISEVSFSSIPEAARPNGNRVGKFVLYGELGRGGMGVVYRAEDEQLGRPVALKVLRERARTDPERRSRFLREARSSAALLHPNVAAVYEVGEAEGELYIAMELVEGQSLRERLVARGGPMSVAEVVPIARGVARALAAAHAKGIVHRDLKPENVMLDQEGEPKVLDFGLAKVQDTVSTSKGRSALKPTQDLTTGDGRLLGTPAYMSPEQAQGWPVDVRSDVFSFGIVLFEMLVGERPFKGNSGMDVAIAIARDPPAKLEQDSPGTPQWLTDIVSVCLAKAPAARYPTARELCSALEHSPPEMAPREERRRARRVVFFAMVTAIVLAVGLALPVRRTRAPSATATSVNDAAVTVRRSFGNLPRPVTKSTEAAEAYATAMQDMRDAYVVGARTELQRAVKLDPTFAAAYVRLLWPWNQNEDTVVDARNQYAVAQQYRTSLDTRDLALLDAAEVFTHEPVDREEAVRRLRAVLQRFPDDVEVLAELARLLIDAGQVQEGREMCELALMIDPQLALMVYELARSHHYGEVAVPVDLIDRCLAISPRAVSCLQLRGIFEREKGQCADYERTSRQILAMAPRWSRGNTLLADALAVRGAPLEGVGALLENAAALKVEQNQQSADESEDEIDIASGLITGDFPRVIAAAAHRDRRHSTSTSEHDHVPATLTIITSQIEEGRDDLAERTAEEFERRTPAWSLNDDRVREYLLYAHRRAGAVGEVMFRKAVDVLTEDDTAHMAARERPVSLFWGHTAFANGSPVDLDIARPYLDAPQFSGHLEAIRGHLLFLSGRVDDALLPLKTGAATCEILPTGTGDGWQGSQAFTFIHSHLWLAEALEAKGDTAGACANYAVVTERWKNARPRSVSLEKAKARSRALHCPTLP